MVSPADTNSKEAPNTKQRTETKMKRLNSKEEMPQLPSEQVSVNVFMQGDSSRGADDLHKTLARPKVSSHTVDEVAEDLQMIYINESINEGEMTDVDGPGKLRISEPRFQGAASPATEKQTDESDIRSTRMQSKKAKKKVWKKQRPSNMSFAKKITNPISDSKEQFMEVRENDTIDVRSDDMSHREGIVDLETETVLLGAPTPHSPRRQVKDSEEEDDSVGEIKEEQQERE